MLITYDLNQLNKMLDALLGTGIEYEYRTKDLAGPTMFSSGGRGHTGTFGMRNEARVEYKIYVKKADLDRAKALL